MLRTNIMLLGMSGVGKSYIGERYALRHGLGFLDTDVLLERAFDRPLAEVLSETRGVERFLAEEQRILLESTARLRRHVISPGGSVVYCDHAMSVMLTRARIVMLDAPFELIYRRHQQIHPPRPIVKREGEKTLYDVYRARMGLYRRYAGRYVVDVSDGDEQRILSDIERLVGHVSSNK